MQPAYIAMPEKAVMGSGACNNGHVCSGARGSRVGSKVVYENPWISVREDSVIRPDGKEGTYGVVTSLPAVSIAAFNDNEEIILVGQERYTSGEFSWELPAGGTDGEEPLVAAKRELVEETGLVAGSWEPAGKWYPHNMSCKTSSEVFIARDLQRKEELQDEEIDEIKSVSLDKLVDMMRQGEMTDGESITAALLALMKVGRISIKTEV